MLFRSGRWGYANQFCYFDYPIYDIAGSTLGVIGYGALGKEIEKRAIALGMKVLINDAVPGPNIVDVATLLRESDIVTLNLPLTPQTKNMISTKELASMKKSACIINTARGGIVDEAALADALRKGVIAGAGFDVLTTEPPKNGNILLDPTIPNLIITRMSPGPRKRRCRCSRISSWIISTPLSRAARAISSPPDATRLIGAPGARRTVFYGSRSRRRD